jgi:hypothetical protein
LDWKSTRRHLGLETPKRKRKRLSEEHRIKIGKGRQKTTARKHYEKAMGWIDGFPNRTPPEPFAALEGSPHAVEYNFASVRLHVRRWRFCVSTDSLRS